MTNQQYIEEIIKVAIQGEYVNKLPVGLWTSSYFLDPNFFRAIGKVKKWDRYFAMSSFGTVGEEPTLFKDEAYNRDTFGFEYDGDEKEDFSLVQKGTPEWKYRWHNFLDKIIEKDLDHAIEWLYNLIKE